MAMGSGKISGLEFPIFFASGILIYKIFVNVGISLNKAGNVPDGKALNAASVGANNVNGPAPDKVPSNEQVSTATFNVV